MSKHERVETSNSRLCFYDVTKQLKQGHYSGLKRVSTRLMVELEHSDAFSLKKVKWSVLSRSYVCAESGGPVGTGQPEDIFFTPEVFSLSERPFMKAWLKKFKGTSGCVFYDAIPHNAPSTTWPKSVRRFPRLLADLQEYDRIFFISREAREDACQAAWELGIDKPDGDLLTLGSNYQDKRPAKVKQSKPVLLQVGIIEPRKGQDKVLDACEKLWEEGLSFKLVLLGRVNPHFGKPIVGRIRQLQEKGRDLLHDESANDEVLSDWHARASLQLSTSLAEGFGLPVMEALWAGCPVIASTQPVLGVIDDKSGLVCLDNITTETICMELRKLLTDSGILEQMARRINPDRLPKWKDTVSELTAAF